MTKTTPNEILTIAYLILGIVIKVWAITKYNRIYFPHFKNKACRLIGRKTPLLIREKASEIKKNRANISFFNIWEMRFLVVKSLPKKNNKANPNNDSIAAEEMGIKKSRIHKLTTQALSKNKLNSSFLNKLPLP